MSAVRGRSLELALLRGARFYAQQGRAVWLQRQEHTAGRTHAHADLIGGVDGVSYVIEAKQTSGDYFPLKPERAAQRAFLLEKHDQASSVHLVIDFVDHREIYRIPWGEVQLFLESAWRRSLSIDWCRAHGLLLPIHKRNTTAPVVLWLEGQFHPEAYLASVRVGRESLGEPRFRIDGDPEREAELDRRRNPQRTKGHEPITPEEARERIRKAIQDGIRRVSKANPRRGWMGGRR